MGKHSSVNVMFLTEVSWWCVLMHEQSQRCHDSRDKMNKQSRRALQDTSSNLAREMRESILSCEISNWTGKAKFSAGIFGICKPKCQLCWVQISKVTTITCMQYAGEKGERVEICVCLNALCYVHAKSRTWKCRKALKYL